MEIEKTKEPGRSWRESRWLILVEFAIVAAIYVGRRRHILKVSATPYLFLPGWICLRVCKLPWRHIGFALYRTWASAIPSVSIPVSSVELLLPHKPKATC